MSQWTPEPPQGFSSEQEQIIIGRPPIPRFGAPQGIGAVIIAEIMNYENSLNMEYESDWFDLDFQQRIPVTVNASQVPSTQTDFPLLINSTFGGLVGAVEAELRFAGEDKVQLEYEIQRFDNGSGELIAWIKKPTIDDGDITFIYFDNPGAIDEQNSAAVWNAHNELGVWHLDNDLSDSTVNVRTAVSLTTPDTAATATFDTSRIGDGFEGLPNYLRINPFPTLGDGTVDEEFSISYWFIGTVSRSAVRYQPSGGDFVVAPFTPAGGHILSWDGGIGGGIEDGISDDGVTHNLVVLNWKRNVSGNGFQAFINGVLSEEKSSADVAIPDLTTPATFGLQFGAFDDGLELTDGVTGHVTIQNERKSVDTMVTEFNNQDAPGTFYAIGILENVPLTFLMGYETT